MDNFTEPKPPAIPSVNRTSSEVTGKDPIDATMGTLDGWKYSEEPTAEFAGPDHATKKNVRKPEQSAQV